MGHIRFNVRINHVKNQINKTAVCYLMSSTLYFGPLSLAHQNTESAAVDARKLVLMVDRESQEAAAAAEVET